MTIAQGTNLSRRSRPQGQAAGQAPRKESAMHPRVAGTMLLQVLAVFAMLLTATPGPAQDLQLATPAAGDQEIIQLPTPAVVPTAGFERYSQYRPTPPPASGQDVLGQCPLYYRQRPYGHRPQREGIKLLNRANEPDWYRHYRCCHFGYYPTQWTPWPCSWHACRYPQGPATQSQPRRSKRPSKEPSGEKKPADEPLKPRPLPRADQQ